MNLRFCTLFSGLNVTDRPTPILPSLHPLERYAALMTEATRTRHCHFFVSLSSTKGDAHTLGQAKKDTGLALVQGGAKMSHPLGKQESLSEGGKKIGNFNSNSFFFFFSRSGSWFWARSIWTDCQKGGSARAGVTRG